MTRSRIVILVVVAALLTALGSLWWEAACSPRIGFLPGLSHAEWIAYPSVVSLRARPQRDLTTEFARSFTAGGSSGAATLRIAGSRRYSVRFNGVELPEETASSANWKAPKNYQIGPLLRSGENEIAIRVSNSNGPPALWTIIRVGNQRLVTDESWRCSYADAIWMLARLARDSREMADDGTGFATAWNFRSSALPLRPLCLLGHNYWP